MTKVEKAAMALADNDGGGGGKHGQWGWRQ